MSISKRNHFRNVVRLQDGLAVATGRNEAATEIITAAGVVTADVTGSITKTKTTVTAATVDAATFLTYEGQVVILNRAGGIDLTLPAATAAMIGDTYEFIVQTTVTDNHVFIGLTNTQTLRGSVNVATDASGVRFAADQSANNTITMNGTTTGGLAGSYLKLVVAGANIWQVSGDLVSSGAEATPFSTSA